MKAGRVAREGRDGAGSLALEVVDDPQRMRELETEGGACTWWWDALRDGRC